MPEGNTQFTDFLETVSDGDLTHELTDRLRAIVREMSETHRNTGGKPKARLTLTIDLKLDGGIFEIVADVTVKPPKPNRARSIFYETPDAILSANNPKQLSLPMETRNVATSIRDLRVAN